MTDQTVELTDQRKHNMLYDEASKILRTNIRFSGKDIKSIVITSCYPNEGKSDVLFQLAIEIAKIEKRVLIVDADMRNSSYLARHQVRKKVFGLSEYLSGQNNLYEVVYHTNYAGLDIIFSGHPAPNPAELLEQPSFAAMMEGMHGKYDYILVDTPPIGNISDAAIAAKNCDGALLVVEVQKVSRKVAEKAKEQLEMSGCRILGAVLNKVDVKEDHYYSKYYRHT